MHPPFLDWRGIVAYLAVALSCGALDRVAIGPAFKKFESPRREEPVAPIDAAVPRAEPARWRDVLLALGEDGLCFVPLLLLGLNPITAEAVAVAAAALHFPASPLRYCVWKGLHLFATALLVLPYGLGCVAAGHLIVLALAGSSRTMELLQPRASR